MKKLLLSLSSLLLGVSGVLAQNETLYTLVFNKDNNQKAVSGYTTTWDCISNGSTWQIVNMNNNSNGEGKENKNGGNNVWEFVRAGRSNNASVAKIQTKFVSENVISSIKISGKLNKAANAPENPSTSSNYLNSAQVKLYDNSDYTSDAFSVIDLNVEDFYGSKDKEIEVEISMPNPSANLAYEIVFDIASSKDNGWLQISKVEYLGESSSDVPSVATPTIKMEEGENGYQVVMTDPSETPTEGYTIYYTSSTDQSTLIDPDNTSDIYEAPIPVSAKTYFKAIAYVGENASSVTSTFIANPPFVSENFAGLSDLTGDTEVEISGNVTGVYQNGQNLYVQDNVGNGMLLYGSTSETIENGDVIAGFSGTYTVYKNLPEVKNYTLGEITKGGEPVQPVEITVADVSKDENLNKYVVLKGVEIVGASGNYTVNSGDESVALYNKFNIEIEDGEGRDIVGVVSKFNENYQLYPITIEGGVVMETVATPTFNPASGELEANAEITISCETEGATIYYTTDKTDPTPESTEYTGPLTFTEDVTIKAIAIKEGMLDSEVAEATYTLYNSEAPESTIVTFDFTDPANFGIAEEDFVVDPSATNNKQYSLCEKGGNRTFTVGVIDMEVSCNTNVTTLPRYYWTGTTSSYDIRLYANSALTLKSNKEGVTIKSIEFTVSGNNNKNWTGNIDYDPDTFNSSTHIWNGSSETTESSPVRVEQSTPSEFIMTLNAEKGNNGKAFFTKVVANILVPTGVSSISEDTDAPEVYYNLQGVRVANPDHGLFIVVKGNQTRKILK